MARKYDIKMFSGNGSVNKEEKFSPVETYNLAIELLASEKLSAKPTCFGDYEMYSILKASQYKLYIGKRYNKSHPTNAKVPETLVITSIKWDRNKEISKMDVDNYASVAGYPAVFYKVVVSYADDPETAQRTSDDIGGGGFDNEKNANKLLAFSTSTELLAKTTGLCYGFAYIASGNDEYTANKEPTTDIVPSTQMITTSGTPLIDVPHQISIIVYHITVKYEKVWDSKNTLKFHNSINILPITIAGLLISERHAWIKSISEERVIGIGKMSAYSKVSYSIAISAENEWIFGNQNMDTFALFKDAYDGEIDPSVVLTSDNRRKIKNSDVIPNPKEDDTTLGETVSEPIALAWDGKIAEVDEETDYRKPHTTYWLDKKQLDWTPLGLPKNNRLEAEIDLDDNVLGD